MVLVKNAFSLLPISLLAVLFVCHIRVFPIHMLSGDIDETTFDTKGSIYLVEKNIVVPAGVSCTIGAGSTLLFKPFTGLLVHGTLTVEGTSKKPVLFTSVYDSCCTDEPKQPAASFDWNGITISQNSRGTVFKHMQLTYSVYGIKSHTENLVIDRCIFNENGLYHFTINENLFAVKQTVPFTYPTAIKSVSQEAFDSSTHEPSALTENQHLLSADSPTTIDAAKTQSPEAVPVAKKTLIRYAALGLGVVGCIGGAVLSTMALKDREDIERMKPTVINPGTGTYYTRKDDEVQSAHESYDRHSAAGVAAFVLGGLGLSGFALTFLF